MTYRIGQRVVFNRQHGTVDRIKSHRGQTAYRFLADKGGAIWVFGDSLIPDISPVADYFDYTASEMEPA